MSSNRNQKRGKYLKGCYYDKKAAALGDNYSPDSIYEFAVEYKKTKDFISDYSGEHKGYSIVKAEEHGTQMQKNNARNFCARCKASGYARYSQCNYRPFVENENVITIALFDKEDDSGFYCKNCDRRRYFYDYDRCKKEAKSTIQDVRLRNRPTKIILRRLRYYCSHCHGYLGMKYLPDLQAYCGGEMTPRLAASVLLSQLSAVKREHIAEAYGLSKSLIDRIKNRMIEQTKEAKLILVHKNVEEHLNSEVICRVFKDKKSGHVYYAYFLKTKAGEIQLINIITQAVRDAAADLAQEPVSFIKRFHQSESFYFTCFCILAGEKHIRGQQLKKRLDELTKWYYMLTNPPKKLSLFHDDPDTPENKVEKRILLNLLRRTYTSGFEETRDRSDLADGRGFAYYMPQETAPSDYVTSFISTFASADQSGSDVPYTEVINRLLYFNPAVIRKEEIEYFTEGNPFNLGLSAFYLEVNRSSPPPFGAPISCLEHFIKNGLLREDNTRLMPCILMQSNTEDRSYEGRELPCGLSCGSCPHLVELT
ncbi:MAG: transposase family protein [Oscillospiraceae bacterium]|nr:transposase family protein [Oscillospiraceae bacterium]